MNIKITKRRMSYVFPNYAVKLSSPNTNPTGPHFSFDGRDVALPPPSPGMVWYEVRNSNSSSFELVQKPVGTRNSSTIIGYTATTTTHYGGPVLVPSGVVYGGTGLVRGGVVYGGSIGPVLIRRW